MADRVIAALELPPNARVADLGSGTGYFAVRLARAVPSGRVWGVDLEPDMVRHLNQRAADEGLSNLFSTLATPDDPLLTEAVDLVLVVNTYHHIADRPGYFERLKAHLRPGGRVAVVDYRKGDLPFGPPDSMKLAPAEVEREMAEAGYAVTSRHDFLPHQYFLIFSAV
jgi:cyclopropane fatty-acyl-phospholipid synthase-like methyltransferase